MRILPERDGKVDISTGVSIDEYGPTKHRFPRIAHLNEIVGTYALVSLHAYVMTRGQTLKMSFGRSYEDPELPPAVIRRAVGSAVNLSAFTIFAMNYGDDIASGIVHGMQDLIKYEYFPAHRRQ